MSCQTTPSRHDRPSDQCLQDRSSTHDITRLGLITPLLLPLIRRNLIKGLLLTLPAAHAARRRRRKLQAKTARVERRLPARRELRRRGRRWRCVVVERRVFLVQMVRCQVRLWVGKGRCRGWVGARRAGDGRARGGRCGGTGRREVQGALDRRSRGHFAVSTAKLVRV